MTQEEHVYFLTTGEEAGPYVLVRISKDGDDLTGDVSLQAAYDEASSQEDNLPARGPAAVMLREAREYAALKGYDLRVQMIGTEWPSEFGSLVG